MAAVQRKPEWVRVERLQKRFDRLCIPEPNSGCWIWLASLTRNGYGQISTRGFSRTVQLATHVSLMLAGRLVPKGMMACHHCDNRACVNPDHLFISDAKGNTADMIKKGRQRWKQRKSFCIHGHLLSGGSVRQRCVTCARLKAAEKRAAYYALGLTKRGGPRINRGYG